MMESHLSVHDGYKQKERYPNETHGYGKGESIGYLLETTSGQTVIDLVVCRTMIPMSSDGHCCLLLHLCLFRRHLVL